MNTKMNQKVIFLAALLSTVKTFKDKSPTGKALIRDNLELDIQVQYNGLQQPFVMSLRGNGLGLSWDYSTPMQRLPDGTWNMPVIFQSSEAGFSCQSCSDPETNLDTGDDFVFRFYFTEIDGNEIAMKGPDFRISLPVSQSSAFFTQKPTFTYWPYFFQTQGYNETLVLSSQDPVIGTRNLVLYVPPSFHENPKPNYELMYMIDLDPVLAFYFQPLLDHIYNTVSRDAIVIGFGDFGTGTDEELMENRNNLLTPVEGEFWFCREGSLLDSCNGCIPGDLGTISEEEYHFWMTVGGCGYPKINGGQADNTLDFLISEANPRVQARVEELSNGQAAITDDRERTAIAGYSLGGLIACYAAWTRPDILGRAACQSSSFWWPQYFNNATQLMESEYFFMNVTLQQQTDNRPKQWIVIDAGDLEEGSISHMALAAVQTFDYMTKLPIFEADNNIWQMVYPGQLHGGVEWSDRLWNALKVLSRFSP